MMSQTPSIDDNWLEKHIRLRVSLVYPEVVLFQVSVLISAILRGMDYLIPPSEQVQSLSIVENAMPLWVWGIMFIVGGVLGLFGLGLRFDKWPITSLGHVILLMTYIGFGGGAFLDVFSQSGITGWRTPVDWMFVFAVTHWAFANASIDHWRDRRLRQKALLKERTGAD